MQTQSAMLARPQFSRSADAEEATDAGQLKIIGPAKSYGRDQAIFGEGEAADLAFKVISGAVRSFRLLADGRRQIADFFLPGDVFGVEFGVDRRATAEAVCESVVVVTRRSTLAQDANHGAQLWRHALRDLQRSQDHVLTLGRRSAAERVASFLIELSERMDAGAELTLPMSRQDMADYLGLTIETVSRTFTHLQSQGLISVSDCRRVTLTRPEALAELCE
jgi:CRP/FNR family nitrogen fixation transcriptional regulator